MNPKYKKSVNPVFAVGVISSAVIAAIASVLYGVAYHTSYDTTIRHFESGAVLPTVFGVLLLMSAVVFTAASLILRGRTALESYYTTSAETFSLWFAAIIFFVFGIFSFSEWESVRFASELGAFCTKLSAPLAMISSIYFLCTASENVRNTTVHRIASFGPVLWGISLLFKYYFALNDMPLNDPELSLTMVSISAALIFFLSESRTALGTNTPAGAVFSASAALCMTGAVSAARLVLWKLDGLVTPSPTESMMLFAVAIIAGARLYSMRHSIVPAPSEIDEEEKTNEKVNETDEEQNV